MSLKTSACGTLHSPASGFGKGIAMFAAAATIELNDGLIPSLKDNDPIVRTVVAIALGQIGNKTAVVPLIDCLKDENAAVWQFSARALGEIGDTSALNSLKELLSDTSQEVVNDASNAINVLEEKQRRMKKL